MKKLLRSYIPDPLIHFYHLALAYLGACIYRFPSRRLCVIAVTGTKGKSTTTEIIAALLRAAGHTVASASTIRFAVGEEVEPNLFKMTMPGRLFLQRFLRRAVNAGCTHAVIEMTSEGARQYRHKGIALDALVFTNLAPEHIESHGSMEKYVEAKLSLARHLERSSKRPRVIVANADDPYGKEFLEATVEKKIPFSLKDAEPYSVDDTSLRFLWRGELCGVRLPGLFNLKNALAALALGEALGLPLSAMKRALEHLPPMPGRTERIERGQSFTVVVDYAHTPESLKALYETYASPSTALGVKRRIIGVLGNTGGGRDVWKRSEMGTIAEKFCDVTILTNEDPYDEDPAKIADDMAQGFSNKKPLIELDRRTAIARALREAKEGDAVLITGKGTDPYIMGKNGVKQEWSDKKVAEKELQKLGYT